MQRQKFITLIGVTAATWPFKARSQQPAPVIGFLGSRSREESTNEVAAFLRGLSEAGYVEGQGVVVEYLWADIQYEKLPALAAELVARHVSVIAATGGPVSGLAVKATTTTIPIVFISGGDPVKLGLVASLNRPGGNATGVNLFITAIEGKRLGLLHELVPAATAIAVMLNPNSPEYEMQLTDVQVAAHIIQVQLQILMAGNEGEVVAAFFDARARWRESTSGLR